MKLPRPIKRILLEQEAVGYEMTRRILALLPQVPVEVISNREVLKAQTRHRAAWLPDAKGSSSSFGSPPGTLAKTRLTSRRRTRASRSRFGIELV